MMDLGHLYEEAWTCEAEGQIAACIREFVDAGNPPHLYAVQARLREQRNEEAESLISRLPAAAVDPLTLPGYIQVVLSNTQRRIASRVRDILHGGLQAGTETLQLLHQGRELLDRAESAVVKTTAVPQSVGAIIARQKMRRENPGQLTGLTTGWPEWDSLTQGLQTGAMHVIGGRKGHGKSLAGAALCISAAYAGIPTLVFSLEMPQEMWLERMACAISGCSIKLWQSGALKPEHAQRVEAALQEVSTWPVTIIDQTSISGTQVFAYASHWAEQHPRGLILVDYVQRMKLDEYHKDRAEEVGEISWRWTTLAGRTDTAVVLLSQLKRDSKGEPAIEDLAQSSGLEADAFTVSLLYRPCKDKEPPEDAAYNQALLLLKKNRNGPEGTQTLHFSGWCTRLRPWIHEWEDANPDLAITDEDEAAESDRRTLANQRST